MAGSTACRMDMHEIHQTPSANKDNSEIAIRKTPWHLERDPPREATTAGTSVVWQRHKRVAQTPSGSNGSEYNSRPLFTHASTLFVGVGSTSKQINKRTGKL